MASHKLNLKATLDAVMAYKDADFVVIAAPTNYDSQRNFFDTSAVEAVIEQVLRFIQMLLWSLKVRYLLVIRFPYVSVFIQSVFF